MEGQRAGKNGKCDREGSKRDIYTVGERKRLMALNIRLLEALLGHLWSMPTPPTAPFPSWSSLWLLLSLGPTLALLTMSSFLNYCPGKLKYSPDSTSLHVLSSSVLHDCKLNPKIRSLHPALLVYTHICMLMMKCYDSWQLHGWLSGCGETIKCYF